MKYKNKGIIFLIFSVILFLFFSYQCFAGVYKGNGNIVTNNKGISQNIDSIEFNTPGQMEIVFGINNYIEIKTDSNLMDYVSIGDFNSTLKVEILINGTPPSTIVVNSNYSTFGTFGNTIIFSHLSFVLHINKFSDAFINSSGDIIISDSFSGEKMSFVITGSGNFNIKKTINAEELILKIGGSGDIKGKIDVSGLVTIKINGSGDISLEGKVDKMAVDINGSGDVNCYELNCKTAEINVNGSGDVYAKISDYVLINLNGSGDVHIKGNPQSVQKNINGSGNIYME